MWEGGVTARRGGSGAETFTVRKVSYGVGVERIFPVHSPIVTRVDVVRQGKVRRAKLYYLRAKKGRTAKLEDREFVQAEVAPVAAVSPAATEAEKKAEPAAAKAGTAPAGKPAAKAEAKPAKAASAKKK